MSNSKKIKSKRRHRVARNRKQRSQGKVITVDIESCPWRYGHSHIGDTHAAMGTRVHQQLEAYATMAGIPAHEVAIIVGGDIIHEAMVHAPGDTYDANILTKLQEDMDDAIARAMAPSMNWSTVRDPRRNPITGQIRPVINDEDET